MAFYDKYIPNELKKVGSEAVDFIRSGSQKLVPKEIRKFLPYLAAAAPYTNIMFPGSGFFSGAIGRGLLSSLYNVAGQAAADPKGEDINMLSAALAGAQGFGATPGAGDTLRGFTTKGQIADKGITGIQADRMMQGRGFFDKAADLGITGTAKVADFLGGAKDTLGKLGAGEKVGIETSKKVGDKIVKDTIMRDLFTKEGAKAAGKALTPMLAQGSADTAKAFADEALRNFEAAELEELMQAGLSVL